MDLINFHRRYHCRGGDCCPPLPANEGYINDNASEDYSDTWGTDSILIMEGDSWKIHVPREASTIIHCYSVGDMASQSQRVKQKAIA